MYIELIERTVTPTSLLVTNLLCHTMKYAIFRVTEKLTVPDLFQKFMSDKYVKFMLN